MSKINVSDFLIKQLNKLGINDIFGVPGDFNFNICTSVVNNKSTKWIGCTNELNAGYAADGYARVNGLGAVLTTYNVGELSALNAIAGSFAENVPVVSIVGWPPTSFIKKKSIVHHTYSEPDYDVPARVFENATAALAVLDEKNAKSEIKRVLEVFLKERKPVYIGIPVDVCEIMIDDDLELEEPQSNKSALDKAVNEAVELINKAQKPVIIGDGLIARFQAKEIFRKLASKSGFPVTTLSMGKGFIDEDEPNFIGTYTGSLEHQNVYDTVQASDCKISIGTIYSDFNIFTELKFNPKDYIEVMGTKVTIAGKEYEDVLMKDFLEALEQKIEHRDMEITRLEKQEKNLNADDKPLNFDYFLPRMEEFFKENDRIFTDTGYLNFSFQSITFPKGATLNIQFLWSSIGWATPAVEGACQADKETRTILLTGEGSHQLTAQELSNMGYLDLKPIIFVLNNSGYSIERSFSKDENAAYNDIIPWNYTEVMKAFVPDAFTAKVKTNKELDQILAQVEKESKNKICYIELFMDKFEAPPLVKEIKQHKIELNG